MKSLFAFALAVALAAGNGFAQAARIPAGAARGDKLDLNIATADQLAALPGLNAAYAAKIVAGRPYLSKRELLSRKILPRGVYEAVKERIIAHRATATGSRPQKSRFIKPSPDGSASRSNFKAAPPPNPESYVSAERTAAPRPLAVQPSRDYATAPRSSGSTVSRKRTPRTHRRSYTRRRRVSKPRKPRVNPPPVLP